MGGFINSQADNEICEVLNKRFSDQVVPGGGQTYLAALRNHFQTSENFLDGNHHLHRLFHRLAISVTGGASVPKHNKSRFRWLFLLRKNLPGAVTTAIKGQLGAILGPASAHPAGAVDYVTFLTRHVTTGTGTFELWSQNSTVPVIYNDANGKKYCKIVLECNTDAPLPDNANEPDPPAADGGESNISAVTKPSARSRTRKSATKKAAAKKKKAAGKKAVTKKAKKGKSRR
jgi:hypothetical protein